MRMSVKKGMNELFCYEQQGCTVKGQVTSAHHGFSILDLFFFGGGGCTVILKCVKNKLNEVPSLHAIPICH